MTDTSNWAGLPDVKIDEAAANLLAAGCEDAAQLIREQVSGRRTLTTNALQDFEGRFSRIFQQNQQTANSDAENIATALEDVARQVRYIVSIVPAENTRRREAREWKARRDKDKSEITLSDLGGDEDPPEGPTSPPAPQVLSAEAAQREDPRPGSGSTSSGTSSARPEELRSFVSGVSAKIQQLDGRPGRLQGLNADFTAGFDWGTGEPTGVDGSGVYQAARLYNQLNHQDKTWVNTIATAFEQAGGSGGMVTLSNAALAASLRAAGVSVSRYDIPPTSPLLLGAKPTTGYSDDPVNASTGNFLEPETDLAFPGGCATLALTRTYNSFQQAVGGFGPGWSSWTDVRLTIDGEAARLTLPDGRALEFPRLGDGWGRAIGESQWLERDEAAGELRVSDNDGGTWRFTPSGFPLSHDRGEGTMVAFVHEGDRLVRLEHERGRHLTLTWDGERVVAATASDGRTVRYAYDRDLRLTAATGPLGTRRYRWDDAGLVDAVVDADGVVEVENSYDAQGRVTSQRSPYGRISRYSYLPGNVTEVSDPDGSRANTWVHDHRGQLIGLVDAEGRRQSTVYDQHGNPVVLTARDGSTTVREFDDRGHVLREVRPSGADLQFSYDDHDRIVRVVAEEGAETRYSYEGTSRHPSLMVDPEGGETRLEWDAGLLNRLVDPTGVELRFGYDEHGDLVSTTNSAGDTARLERDGSGRIVAATTPRGHRTAFTYGPHGLATRQDPDGSVWLYEHSVSGRMTAVIDPTGGRTEVEYGDDGEERRRIDPLGRAVERRLDDLGNLSSVELPDGSTWRFTHDALSRLTSTTSPDGHTWQQSHDSATDLVTVEDPLGHRVSVSGDEGRGRVDTTSSTGTLTDRFDPLGRLVSSEQPDGSVAVATYDRCGRVVEQLDGEGALTRIERDPAGRPVAVTDPTGRVTRYEYDACGRRSAVVGPDGARTTIDYNADSLPVRCTFPTGEVGWSDYDACGRVTSTFTPGVGGMRLRYDAAGRIVELRDSSSGLRRFTYDAAGQLVAATDGNGGVTRYDYDALGRATTVTDPLGNITRREFDTLDRCTVETDPLGRTTRAGYDALGRQVWQEDPSGRRTEWTYDGTGRVVAVTVDGSPVSTLVWDLRGRTVRTTDHTRPDGRVVAHTTTWNGRGQVVRRSCDDETTTWSHDAAGRRTSMTLPDGSTVAYDHDAVGRLASVDHPLLGRATFEHDAAGRLTAAAAGDLVQSWEYADGFVVAHTVTDADGADRTTVERDDDGRIRAVERGGTRTTFDHDAACQLVGSRVGDQHVRWRYDAAGRLVAEARPEGTDTLTYDAAGQLLTVEGPEGTTRHSYDDAGRRVRTVHPDGRTRDLEWSPTGWLASIVDHAGGRSVRTRLHVDASGRLASIDDVPIHWDSPDDYAPALVQVGATPVVAAGGLTGVGQSWTAPGWRSSRSHGDDVWATAAPAVPGLPEGIGISPAGELTIGGLEWIGARVYDATSRGFLSVDPLDPVAGAGWAGNPYSYAGNDPLHALDPTGLKPVSEAELKAANAPWYEQAWDFVKEQKDWIIGGVLVVGGIALMATGVGGPLGAMALSAGADVLIQKATTGKVNYAQAAVSGLAGGAGFVASKGLTIGGRAIVSSTRVAQMSMRAKVGVQAGIGMAEGYSYQVAGGADPLSRQAFGGGAAGGLTGGLGQFAKPLGEHAGSSVSTRILAGVDDKPFIARGITRAEAWVGNHVTDHAVRGAYKGTVDAGGEFLKQVTDDQDGVDYGKVGGKAVGGGLAKPLPTGVSSPAGRGISAGFDTAVS
ncbi:DUF6531 domain-containing protein [Nocardioides sp. GXQ0305]|uniref:DUF6531 domain-containing protein n=1 Tax=Nocardioides sp. GXQ0305 TaxID=3423912 RepID=UPI003D7D4BD1